MAKMRIGAAAALALAFLASPAAHAVTPLTTTYNFDFNNASTRISSTSGVGNSYVYKSTTDAGLQVKVTAWSIDKKTSSSTDDIVTAAILQFYSGYGFGVQNKYEDGSSPNHSIDNSADTPSIPGTDVTRNMVDFVLLQFNWDVDINTVQTGWVSGDSDMSLRVGSGPTGNPGTWATTKLYDNEPVDDGNSGTTTDLTNYLTTSMTSYCTPTFWDSSCASSSGSSRPVNSNNEHGMMWLIGALYGTHTDDFFKLETLNVRVFPTIPEPSTWMTMILGFGFVGATMRRRKTSFGKRRALA